MAGWKCPNLKVVKLQGCGIDKMVSLELPSLEDIDLWKNEIKDISFLQTSLSLTNLRFIDFS